MCGINGFVSNRLEESKINIMNAQIQHRGPDDAGVFVQKNKDQTIALGMTRLAIIDINSGNQPVISDDGNRIIVFNGEIYNYKILKKALEDTGVFFSTKSDTEVILKLYEKYGTEAFHMLDGMFAFSIYDKLLNKVFIARDYFGEKPLYYTISNDEIIWASELKSILQVSNEKWSINKEALNLYFNLTYIPAPFTIYNDIFKLEANHFITWDINSNNFEISEIKHSFVKYPKLNKTEAIKEVHDLVFNSVVSRSVSDVPIGTFLSGGVDSSIVSYCLAKNSSKKIDTFSIGFDKKSFDESEKATTVSKLINSNHHQFIITEKDLENSLNKIILNFDEPFADSSALPTYVVSEKTRKFVKVALTGDGGDEVFGGYNKYYMGKLNQKYISTIPSNVHSRIVSVFEKIIKNKDDNRGFKFKMDRLVKSINYENEFYFNIISLGFQKNELASLFKNEFQSQTFFSKYSNLATKDLKDFRNVDRVLSLEGDLLVKVDRTSMLNSLESRAPFLNKELWNFTNQLPENYLINKWDKKHLLKEAFKEYFPKDFLNKSKKGFGVPVGDWLRGNLRKELEFYSEKEFIIKQNIFNFEIIKKIIQDHLSGKKDNTFRVWTYYCFQKWYIHNLEQIEE